MHHAIRAIIGSERRMDGLAQWSYAVAARLPQGFTLVLVTRAMREDIEELVGFDTPGSYPEFQHLSLALERVIAQGTLADPIAYFETHYGGEVGFESAAVWQRRRLVLGPLRLERPSVRDPRADPTAPVNAALRRLGVWHRPGRDEFEELGLSRFASMDAQ